MNWLRSLRRFFRIERPRQPAVVSAPSHEAESPSSPGPTTPVVVGLDFGTSGTKVVVRLPYKNRPAWAVDFGTDRPGFSRFSFPSTVSLRDSRFLFGMEAEECTKGTVVRSLKRTLLTFQGSIAGAGVEEPPRPQDLGAHPHFLVAAYLGAVLRRVRELVTKEYGADVDFLYNLDIPVAQLDDGAVQRGFQTVLDAAVDFAEAEGIRETHYHGLWRRWQKVLARESTGLADREHKRWELFPESLMIVKGAYAALESILKNSRRYTAIVDIGAGTTDMAWFKWGVFEDDDRAYFFSAKTSVVGCDDVDKALLDILRIPNTERSGLASMVREAKARLADGLAVSLTEDGQLLESGDLRRAVVQVAGRCFEGFGKSFGEAYKKERNTNEWRDIRVILVGGGSLLDGFRVQFGQHPRPQFGRSVDLKGARELVADSGMPVGAFGESTKAPGAMDIVFLLPALGLAHPGAEIPVFKRPEEIRPVRQLHRGPTGVYDYEAPDDD